MIKNAVYNILINDATLEAIVGTKIYPIMAPQETEWPFIVIQKNSVEPTDIKGAVSTDDVQNFQVDCYARTEREVQTISARIRVLLDQYSGTVSSINVQNIVFENETDGDFNYASEVFAKSQDYRARIKN